MLAFQIFGFRPMELAFVLLVLLILFAVALMVRTRKKGEDDWSVNGKVQSSPCRIHSEIFPVYRIGLP